MSYCESYYDEEPKMTYRGNGASNFFGHFVFCLPFFVWATLRIIAAVQYDIYVGDYLARAANANTIELAKQELDTALVNIEQRHWTEGSTHVLWYSPSTDVGYWHTNLKAASEELGSIKRNTSPLETSNILLKLRETIGDTTQSGLSVSGPEGLSVFPQNKFYSIFGWSSFLLASFVSIKWFLSII